MTSVRVSGLVASAALLLATAALAASQHSVSRQHTHPRSQPSPVNITSPLANPGVLRGQRLARGQVLIYRFASIRRSDKAGFSFSLRCPARHHFEGIGHLATRNQPLFGPILGSSSRSGGAQVTPNPNSGPRQGARVYALCAT